MITTYPAVGHVTRTESVKLYTNRHSQVKRAISLIVMMSGRGRTINELANHFGVSTKTIRRDINALEDVNIPVYVDRNEDSVESRTALWRVDPHWMKRFM